MIRRHLLSLLLIGCTGLGIGAEELHHDAQLLAAARAANQVYQRHLEALATDLTSDDSATRAEAIALLGHTDDPVVIPLLLPFLDPDVHPLTEVKAAILALTAMGVDINAELRALIARENEELTPIAYNGLARLQSWAAPDWRQRTADWDRALRASGVTNLGTDTSSNAGQILADALERDDRAHIRRMAAIGIKRLDDPAFGPTLERALTDPDPMVRRYAGEGLAALRYMDAVPELLMALEANVAGKHLNRSLMLLTGQDFGFDHRADILARKAAIQRGFEWYTANADGF